MHLLERPDEGHFLINLERKEDGKNPPNARIGTHGLLSLRRGLSHCAQSQKNIFSILHYFFKTKIYYKIWQDYQGPKMDFINTKHSRDKFTKA